MHSDRLGEVREEWRRHVDLKHNSKPAWDGSCTFEPGGGLQEQAHLRLFNSAMSAVQM